MKELNARLEERDIYKGVEDLWNTVERGKITTQQRREFEGLDKYITESMLELERKIPKKYRRGWSPDVNRSAQMILYLWVLMRRVKGYNIGEHVVGALQR